MSETGKYEEFRKLLKYGMGDSGVSEFANRAGISRVSLSRMLNMPEIGRPQEETIIKIADAMDGRVLRDDLLASCGYKRTATSEKLLHAHEEIKAAVSEYFTKGVVFPGIQDILDVFDLLYFSEDMEWSIGLPDEEGTIKKSVITGKWKEGDYTYRFLFGLEYVNTDDGKVCIIKAHTEYEDMIEFAKDARLMKVIKECADHPEVCTEAVGFAERRNKADENHMPEEELLLRAIFGHETGDKYEVIMSGCGVTYNETPEGFADFLNEYRDVFCVNVENAKLYQRVVNGEDPDEVFKDFTFEEVHKGTGEAVAFIMSKVTGERFTYEPDETDSGDGVVACMLGDNAFGSPEIDSNLLLYDIRAIAKVLKPAKCGIVYHKWIANRDDRIYSPDDPFNMEATVRVPYEKVEEMKKKADEYSGHVLHNIDNMPENSVGEDVEKDLKDPRSNNIGGFCGDLKYLLNKYKGQGAVDVPMHVFERFKEFEQKRG